MNRASGGGKTWIAGLLALVVAVFVATFPRFADASEIRIKVPLRNININPGGEKL